MQQNIFDRQQENITTYESIYKEFGELVNTLIECFCADSNIQKDEVFRSLRNTEIDKLTLRQKASLEPIAAAENFNVFVPMMMRKNVELQLQALQMIEFMCGLIPSALQIEDGETLKNKDPFIPSELTERYVLISVMRQSKEEFDNLSKLEIAEIEEVLRNSEEERLRLEQERDKEQKLVTEALVQSEKVFESPMEKVTSTSSESTKQTGILELKEQNLREDIDHPDITEDPETKSTGRITTIKDVSEREDSKPLSPKDTVSTENEQIQINDIKLAEAKSNVVAESGNEKEKTKKVNVRPSSSKNTLKSTSAHTESLKRNTSPETRYPSVDKAKDNNINDEKLSELIEVNEQPQMLHGPRGKTMSDVNALLQQPNRLNSALIRNREKYLRMQRDRLLQMKAIEREKQMNDITKRTAQERPRTARAARGMMRGSLIAIGADDTLAARRAVVEKVKAELGNTSDFEKYDKL
ncbi:hypothetical protein DICVIV_13133 [Dictyocaulus viviparus]|uniref:Cilia- and flagella-associated protein 36 n=1 Tax=Dictyocaulus viviparus TaxID=29172 RepID=A0A0D8XEP7_DICVI|nr:hypothetical protein DICVIV_13133 [Dictyocaulus viviparus]